MIVKNIILRDNGIRSFVPPCFNWELVSEDGSVVSVVSQIVISSKWVGPASDLEYVIQNRLPTSGHTEEYSVQIAERETKGILYTVTQIEEKKANKAVNRSGG